YPIMSAAAPETDLCPFCGLRLIDREEKARKSCRVCLKESGGTAKEWWDLVCKQEQCNPVPTMDTIWLEEIADDNGRLALLTGRFFPEHFMAFDYLPNKKSQKNGGLMFSAAAFARQRRIWESCREFWYSIEEDIGKLLFSNGLNNSFRLHIKVAGIQRENRGDRATARPSSYHAYELLFDEGISLTAIWTGEDFVTIENLKGFEKRNNLGIKTAAWLREQKGRTVTIRIPGGYGSKAAAWGQADISEIQKNGNRYLPVRHILSEPRTFMCLLPADKALELIRDIKSNYEKKMGQVRGRMPLHLGVIFADRYTPLRAILDAGRRMLNRQCWATFSELTLVPENDSNGSYLLYLRLKEEGVTVCWPISKKVPGSLMIEDGWYSYFPVQKLAEREESRATQEMKGEKGEGKGEEKKDDEDNAAGSSVVTNELVHVKNLVKGDQVYLYPSIFDFEYLDSAGVRFEIAYGTRKRKLSEKAHRPYLLEQIDELDEIWNVLGAGALNRNQIYALRDIISSKRREWGEPYSSVGETFRQFCRDILVTASWNKVKKAGKEKAKYPWESSGEGHEQFFDRWADFAVRGLFEDVVQLHMQIMKKEIDVGGKVNER
ncbi:MAG: hypothetical protein ACOX7L_08535, partial [Dethiobacteria bacterium]